MDLVFGQDEAWDPPSHDAHKGIALTGSQTPVASQQDWPRANKLPAVADRTRPTHAWTGHNPIPATALSWRGGGGGQTQTSPVLQQENMARSQISRISDSHHARSAAVGRGRRDRTRTASRQATAVSMPLGLPCHGNLSRLRFRRSIYTNYRHQTHAIPGPRHFDHGWGLGLSSPDVMVNFTTQCRPRDNFNNSKAGVVQVRIFPHLSTSRLLLVGIPRRWCFRLVPLDLSGVSDASCKQLITARCT